MSGSFVLHPIWLQYDTGISWGGLLSKALLNYFDVISNYTHPSGQKVTEETFHSARTVQPCFVDPALYWIPGLKYTQSNTSI